MLKRTTHAPRPLSRQIRSRAAYLSEALECRCLLSGDPSGLAVKINGVNVGNGLSNTVDITSSLANGGHATMVVTNTSGADATFSEQYVHPGFAFSPTLGDINTKPTFDLAAGASQTFTIQASGSGVFSDPIQLLNPLLDVYEFTLYAAASPAKQTPPLNTTASVIVADEIDTSGLQPVGNTNGETYMGLTAANSNLQLTVNAHDNGLFSSTPALHLQLIRDANSNGLLDASEIAGASLLDTTAPTDQTNHTYTVTGVPAGNYFVYGSPTVTTVAQHEVDTARIDYSLGVTAAALAPGVQLIDISSGATISSGQSSAFGTAQSGAAPLVKQYTVKNTGTGVLNLSNLQVAGNAFDIESQLPATLAPNATATFSVGLLTGSAGNQSGTVSFNTNVSGQTTFSFGVSGTVAAPAAPSVSVYDGSQQISSGQTQAINFGSATVGATAPSQTLTIRNTGTAALTIGAVSVPSGFTLTGAPGTSVAPGGSSNFIVALNTSAAGSPSGQITFTTNDSGHSTFSFPVAGAVTVAATPAVAVFDASQPISSGQSAPVSFGSATVGAVALRQTFTVRNTGTAALTLGTVSVPAGFTLSSAPAASVAPGRSSDFTVALSTDAAGVFSGPISFITNDAAHPTFSFSVSGAVTAMPQPSIAVSSASGIIASGQSAPVDFQSVTVGAAAPSQTFTVANGGAADLVVGAVSVPAGFILVSGLSSPIAPGATASFTVELDSTTIGNFGGSVSFTTNDPSAATFTFPVSGAVTSASGPNPPPADTDQIAVTQVVAQRLAASVVGGQKSSAQVLVTLKNLGNAALPGSAIVTLYASSSTSSVGAGSIALGHAAAKLKLKAGASQVVKVKVAIPAVDADQTDSLIAQVTGSGITSASGAIGAASGALTIHRPFVSLSGPGAGASLATSAGATLTLPLLLTNQGDVAATGVVSLNLLLSTDATLASATQIASSNLKINLKPGAGKVLKVKFSIPASTSAGSYTLLMQPRGAGALGSLNLLDGQVVASFPITIA